MPGIWQERVEAFRPYFSFLVYRFLANVAMRLVCGKVVVRVDIAACSCRADPDFKMQVRARGMPGVVGKPDLLAPRHMLSDGYRRVLEMAI